MMSPMHYTAFFLPSLLQLLLLSSPAEAKEGPPHHNLRRSLQTAPFDLLTQSIFDTLAPSAQAPYSYTGLRDAVTSWNTANPAQQIFTTGTELQQRHEIAAFLGHTLHESGDYIYPRELSQCGTTANANGNTPWSSTLGGTLYCQYSGYTSNAGPRSDPYCSAVHTNTSSPDGCNCSPVTEVVGAGYDANELYFGRGPIQLSWNYNYIDAGDALGVNLCDNLIWLRWTKRLPGGLRGATTCHDAIVNGDFGGSLNAINGGLECPATGSHVDSVISRLDDYCRAVVALSAESLLSFDGCDGLETRLTECLLGNSCPNCVGIPTTAQPTSSPSLPVTLAPTTSPTVQPTSSPVTPNPTTNPSNTPTIYPTKSPSISPSRSPSNAPSMTPTVSPTTAQPTTSPSTSPSRSPSKAPSMTPTGSPTTAQPTTSPSTSPSKSPSTSPSVSPTVSPTTAQPTVSPTTARPTTSPSISPSKSPSTSPSKAPTGSPTPAPSRSPVPCLFYTNATLATCVNDCNEGDGVWPPTYPTLEGCCSVHHSWSGPGGYDECMRLTESPTTSPSTSPSRSPSKAPSMTPTGSPTTAQPTTSPSISPSKSPSISPSVAPTVSPTTAQPTTSPSISPSKSPSKTPSKSPTGSPTPAPSRSPTTCMFYTDWSGTCLSDCNEGEWPPPLYETLEDCCRVHYTWAGAYEICMDITDPPSSSPTLPPTANPTTAEPTKSPTPAPSRAPSPCMFYTDWFGTCINDCNEGEWHPPLHGTLEECCRVHYTWAGAYETCMDITDPPSSSPTLPPTANPTTAEPTKSPIPAPSDPPSATPTLPPVDESLFYVNWSVAKCVQNCDQSNGAPCGGINRDSWVLKHADVQKCCKAHLSYLCPDPDVPCAACTDADLSGFTPAMPVDSGTTVQASETNAEAQSQQTVLYWVDWDVIKCVENCDPSTGPHCKGPPEHWRALHSDLATCCQVHLNFTCPDLEYPCKSCTDVPFEPQNDDLFS